MIRTTLRLLPLAAMLLLGGCNSVFCLDDPSGVERSPWAGRGPDANRGPAH